MTKSWLRSLFGYRQSLEGESMPFANGFEWQIMSRDTEWINLPLFECRKKRKISQFTQSARLCSRLSDIFTESAVYAFACWMVAKVYFILILGIVISTWILFGRLEAMKIDRNRCKSLTDHLNKSIEMANKRPSRDSKHCMSTSKRTSLGVHVKWTWKSTLIVVITWLIGVEGFNLRMVSKNAGYNAFRFSFHHGFGSVRVLAMVKCLLSWRIRSTSCIVPFDKNISCDNICRIYYV